MEHNPQELLNKLKRYENKLRDIVIAYKKLQSDKESLAQCLRLAEVNVSNLHHELEEKNKLLDSECARNADLNEKITCLIIEKDKYREDAEKVPYLKQRIDQLLKDFGASQISLEALKAALAEAQERHETSTQHFEARISDIISTFKTYQEIHDLDTEAINQLRSCKTINPHNPIISKAARNDFILALVDHKNNDSEASKTRDLFEFMHQLWQYIIKDNPLQQSAFEKQLLQLLELRSIVPKELVEASEREKRDLQQELEIVKVRLMSLQDDSRKLSSPLSPAIESLKESFSFDGSSSSIINEQNLKMQFHDTQDHIKLLRKQNLAILIELESVKKSMQCKLEALEKEAANRLAKATSQHESQLARLESEASRYREQTLNLLAEKEEEIGELRSALALSNHEVSSSLRFPAAFVHVPSVGGSEGEEFDSSSTNTPFSFDESLNSHCGLMHCAERYGRIVLDLKKLRSTKRKLEHRVETLEMQLWEERKVALEAATTAKVTLTPSSPPSTSSLVLAPENVNWTYIKNVVFNLLFSFSTSSSSSKIAMIKALSMALHFSSEEENALIRGITP